MKLTKGSRVAFTAKHAKFMGSYRVAQLRGTYQGEDSTPGYCRVIWDDAPLASQYADDAEYCEMARTVGELHPVGIICAVKSAKFADTYA